jgi:hypothetical protein
MMNAVHIALGIFCLLVASLADARAVAHATQSWHSDQIQIGHVIKVFAYYLVSIVPFLYSIRFFGYAVTVSPSIQVLIWFLSTVVFIAILDKSFFGWGIVNQIIGLALVIGMATLVYRTH